ncbi:hypothetical protein CEXT_488111 [Caerostris extrusa]|uniref:Uncharacterized protein n=1 Tax=Caerostris extrusa TaxID=172846 RepID=A0AAV4TF94_CAEEX|nr:hypothetical protein CEXT_488111 [Caerostris extrusa]
MRFPTLSTTVRILDLKSETLTKSGGFDAKSRIKFPRTPTWKVKHARTISKARFASTAMLKEGKTMNGKNRAKAGVFLPSTQIAIGAESRLASDVVSPHCACVYRDVTFPVGEVTSLAPLGIRTNRAFYVFLLYLFLEQKVD